MLAAKEEARRAKQEEEFKADLSAMEKKRKAKDLEAKKSLVRLFCLLKPINFYLVSRRRNGQISS